MKQEHLKFRPLQASDLHTLYNILSSKSVSHGLHWAPSYEELLGAYQTDWQDPDEAHYLMLIQNTPVGWLKLNGLCGPELWISMLAIAPEYQGKHLGRAALDFAEAAAKERHFGRLNIQTTVDNLSAVALYIRSGFRLVHYDARQNRYGFSKSLDTSMAFRLLTANDADWLGAAEFARICSWRAGTMLADFMEQGHFSDWERVLIAKDGDKIAGFCTVQKRDCIPGLSYTPYISTLFVAEPYRGRRLSERLIDHASNYLKALGFHRVYLISDHIGLYEKYGFQVVDRQKAPWGEVEKVYQKII